MTAGPLFLIGAMMLGLACGWALDLPSPVPSPVLYADTDD